MFDYKYIFLKLFYIYFEIWGVMKGYLIYKYFWYLNMFENLLILFFGKMLYFL